MQEGEDLFEQLANEVFIKRQQYFKKHQRAPELFVYVTFEMFARLVSASGEVNSSYMELINHQRVLGCHIYRVDKDKIMTSHHDQETNIHPPWRIVYG
jgi:hypothetical protein